ncbi:hypothetical protein DL768_007084 [Monosporascus sp. mg162]|nr:hypothetical protein DL768_007084 [Monosporascus sp. mg162]
MVDAEETKANQAYRKQYQRQTLKFRYYRESADDALLRQPRRRHVKHRRGPIAGKRDSWDQAKWQRDPNRIGLDSITHEDGIPDDDVVARDAWRLLGETKRWFGGPPKFDYQKCLGYGGMGLALHYKYSNPRVGDGAEDGDCVLKVSLEGGKDKNIRDEIRATQEKLPSDDSSIPAQSSADEADYKEPPQRVRRKDMTPYERARKMNTPRVQQRRRKLEIKAQEARLKAETEARERKRSLRTRGKGKEPAMPDDEDAGADAGDEDHDYILLEYMKNGDMANMLYRLNEQDEKVPNRVLWSFFLCLIRGCIGMAWYPRRFHPQRGNNPDQNLIEQTPAEGSVQERCMKRTVHFDIDPKNSMFCFRSSRHRLLIFIQVLIDSADGPSDDPGSEHRFVPRIKEQFTQDWDTLPLNRNGSNVCDEPIAGAYGPPTNIWHVGLPRKIQHDGRDIITYGAHLDEPVYATVDDIDPSEHDPMITAWVNKLVYNADENGNAGPTGPAGPAVGVAGPAAGGGGDDHSSDIYN